LFKLAPVFLESVRTHLVTVMTILKIPSDKTCNVFYLN